MSTRTEAVIAALGLVVAKRKLGRAWMFCPFHEARRATTFSIRTSGERAGDFHCWACSAHGGLTRLVMHVRGCEIEKAREFIAKLGRGIEAERRKARVIARAPMLGRRLFALPESVHVLPLEEWVSGARSYVEERGITREEVIEYGLGYAVDGQLAGRIVFPARGSSGRALTYSARTFVGEEPKYLTPSADEHPDLDALFGAHLWGRCEEATSDVVLIAEGAINAMTLRAATKIDVAAIGGSDVRLGHVSTIAARFDRFVVVTDPDGPGDKAARMFQQRLGRHGEFLRVRLRAGQDAASTNRDELREKISRALEERVITRAR